MNAVTSIALSGLNAATLRLFASANNVANMRSIGSTEEGEDPAPFTPLEVHETAVVGGGVMVSLAPSSRDALLAYDPQAPFADAQGYVAAPNIDVVEEMLQMATARYGFAANLQVLRTNADMQDDLLRILA
jgi:flagellar basal-body rod protein FlgC